MGQEVHEVGTPAEKNSLLRYALLAYVLCLRRISEALREQFPHAESLVLAGLDNAGQLMLQSGPGLATRRELQLLEGEADLGRVWHVPISWSMIMIRRFAVINTTWTFDNL